MWDTVRESAFGQLTRLVTKNRVFKYKEEKDPSHLDRWLNKEKSGYAAEHGILEPEEEDDDDDDEEKDSSEEKDDDRDVDRQPTDRSPARENTRTQSQRSSNSAPINEPSGKRIHPENGKDIWLVDWEENDPEV